MNLICSLLLYNDDKFNLFSTSKQGHLTKNYLGAFFDDIWDVSLFFLVHIAMTVDDASVCLCNTYKIFLRVCYKESIFY